MAGHVATLEDVVRGYVEVERERLERLERFVPGDEEMLRQEVYSFLASVYEAGRASTQDLQQAVSEIIENDDAPFEGLDEILEDVQNHQNPYVGV